MFQSKRFGALTLALLSSAALAAGCGDDDTKGGDAAAENASTTAGKATDAEAQLSPAERDWAVEFTKGTPAAADSTKEPFVIGFANQQGGVPNYPEATVGAQKAVDFINKELGGVDGRPVKLKTCFILSEEDGQKCGAEFVGDTSVQAVVMGLASVGNASLYKTVLKKLPVLVATSAAQADQATPGVYTLNGGSLSPIAADALLAGQVPGAKKVAVIHSNNPVGTFVATKVQKPVLESQKLEVSLVPVGDAATAPEVTSAIQASGAATAQVFSLTTIVDQCISAYDALKQQNIKAKVITTYQCSQPAMSKHLDGKLPEGWVFTSFSDSPRIPNLENGRDSYVAAMKGNGADESATFNGDAANAFATLMTLTRLGNELGAKAAPETIRKAIVAYDGPLMMTPGKPQCGKVSKTFPGICTTLAAAHTYENGKLTELPPIDVKPIVK
jgi:branched-chain amino acid transport system substrate-binding protein